MTDAMPAPFDVKLMNIAASALFVACGVMLVATGIWWALRNPAFSLAGITITGDRVHNNAVTLRANVAHRLRGNFFTVDLAQARTAFESVPWVRRAVVQREFPNRLRVILQEHQALAYWGVEDESKLLNTQGEVFDANTGDVEQDDMPRLSGPDAASAPQVLALYQAIKPLFDAHDLIVTELFLPEVDGFELLRWTENQPPPVPKVIAMTAGTAAMPVMPALLLAKAQAAATLPRPFEPAQLLGAIAAVVSHVAELIEPPAIRAR